MKYTKYRKRDANGQMKSMWTPKRRKLAKKLYVKDGLSLRKVAAHFECAHAAVQKLAEEEGWIRKRRSDVNNYADEIKRLYLEELWSAEQISKKLGFTTGQIHHHINYHGGYCRDIREAGEVSKKTGAKLRPYATEKAIEKYLSMDISKLTWSQYRYVVHKFTTLVLTKFGGYFDKLELRGREHNYNVDHIFSVRDGFMKWSEEKGMMVPRRKVVPLSVICHPANLRIVRFRVNMDKGSRSLYSMKQLHTEIANMENEHGVFLETA